MTTKTSAFQSLLNFFFFIPEYDQSNSPQVRVTQWVAVSQTVNELFCIYTNNNVITSHFLPLPYLRRNMQIQLAHFLTFRLCSYYLDSFSCRQKKLSGMIWKNIWYVTLHFRDWRGPASLRYRNSAEITVLMCGQKPYPGWFSCRRKSYPFSCEHSLDSISCRRQKLSSIVWPQP